MPRTKETERRARADKMAGRNALNARNARDISGGAIDVRGMRNGRINRVKRFRLNSRRVFLMPKVKIMLKRRDSLIRGGIAKLAFRKKQPLSSSLLSGKFGKMSA